MIRFLVVLKKYPIAIFLISISSFILNAQTTVNTISELRALSPGSYQIVTVLGYYSAGDWGEPRSYNWIQPNNESDNGGTIIVPSTASTGRWIMEVPEEYYNIRWFGASPNLINNQVFVQRAADAIRLSRSESFYTRKLYVPAGIYNVTHRIFVNNIDATYNGMEIFGDGHSLPRLVTDLQGSNNDIVFVEKENRFDGVPKVEYIHPGAPNSGLNITVSYPSKKITVHLATDASGNIITTANDIIKEIRRIRMESPTRENNPTLLVMVYNAPESDGSGIVTPMGELSLQDNSENASIFRLHDSVDFRVVMFRLRDNEYVIREITIRDLELDGNNLNNISTNAMAISAQKYQGYTNLIIENIYAHHWGEIGGPIANGIGIDDGYSVVRNCISSHNWGGGFALDSETAIERPVRFENIHSYRNGLLFAARGINFSSAEYAEVYDFTLVDNWSGIKAASDFGHIVLRNGIVLREIPSNPGEEAASWNLDHSGVVGDRAFWDIDGVIIDGTNNVGGVNLYGRSKIGKMVVRNTSTDAMIFRGNGSTIEELLIENSGGGRAGLLMWGSDQEIKTLKVVNSEGAGVIASGRILTGHFENCSKGAIQINQGKTLELYNTKFINNRVNEIYEYGESTLIYSGLDFSQSIISPNDRIRVTNVSEIASVRLVSPNDSQIFKEGFEIKLEAFASAPGVAVQKIEFFVNNSKIGEMTVSPYIFIWEDLEAGEYSVKAIVTFSDNSRLESNSASIVINPGRKQKSQHIFLQPGWNTISTYVEPYDVTLSSLFGDVESNLLLLNNNAGKVYWPLFDIDEINSWNYREGYQIFIGDADTLIVNGLSLLPDETPIHLKNGWNLTAYLLDYSLPIETALKSVKNSIGIVLNNNGEIYWPEYGINAINELQPGQGYRIFSNNDVTFHYPLDEKPSSKMVTNSGQVRYVNFNPLSPRQFVIDKPLTGINAILLVESEIFSDVDEVGVWTEKGELVGSGVVNNGRAAVTVWGENVQFQEDKFGAATGELLRLTVWSTDQQKEHLLRINKLSPLRGRVHTNSSLFFEPNAVIIVNVDIDTNTPNRYSLIQNFPNPFNPSTTIRYNIPREEKVKLEVYNLLGQKVETLVDDVHQAGSYEIIFKADHLASGVYFYRLSAGNFSEVMRMILLR
jgi:hypothetical protein